MEIKLNSELGKRSREDAPWLLSYSDMVTLLLAFFVLFFAISQVDQVKYEMIMEYFNKSQTTPLRVLEQQFKQLVREHQLEQSVDVNLTPDGLLVNFQDQILFDSGKAELKQNALPLLTALADILNARKVAGRKIQVQGHTDSLPLVKNARYPSNWELSTARSSSVIRFLLGQSVAANRFEAIGYADTQPKQAETDAHRGLSVNRRVSLLIK